MTAVWTLLVVLLSYLVSFSSAGYQQIFPVSYEFNRDHYSTFQEPLETCPENTTRPPSRDLTLCRSNGTSRPKLMDCDVEGDLYHLNTDDKFQFWFTYAQALSSSIVIIHYECMSTDVNYKITTNTSNSSGTEIPLDCKRRHQGLFYNSTEPYLEVRLVFITQEGGEGIHLKEAQHFIKTEDSLDDCGTLNCCTTTDICTEPGGYTCLCPNGFYGINCQNGNCANTGVLNTYNCTICPNEFTGDNCEIQVTTTSSSSAAPNETLYPMADSPDDSSSSSSPAAAIGGVLVVLLVIATVTVLVSVVALVCYRRKKGKKRHGVIQHVGEDESNTYALVHKPKKRKDAAPAIPDQNFDPVYEGLENPPTVHSDPSTGQSSTSPLPNKKNGFKNLPEHDDFQEYSEITRPQEDDDTSDSQHDSPSLHPSSPPEHSMVAAPWTYDTVDDTERSSPDPYYSTPAAASNGYPPASRGEDDGGEGEYEDTQLPATDWKISANLSQENIPVAVEKDAIAMDLEMYAAVN